MYITWSDTEVGSPDRLELILDFVERHDSLGSAVSTMVWPP